MDLICIEGIVLQSLPFRDYDKILTVFTPEGLQKFFAKGTKRYNPLTSPLTVAEFVYTPGKKNLHQLQDATLIDQNLNLRKSLESLVAVEKLSFAILQSQMDERAAPSLYKLFRLFLLTIPYGPHPENLSTAFYLKVMKHEGILQLYNSASFRFAGECYKKEEAPTNAVEMSLEEELLLTKIAGSRSLKEILELSSSEEFEKKIEKLFLQAFPSIH